MSDTKRKFKIFVKKAKTTGGTDFERVEIGSVEVKDEHDKPIEETITVGAGTTAVVYTVKGKFKKGYMWDKIEDLDVTTANTTVTIEAKSFEAKAEQWRLFPWTIPGILIILALIAGAVWYFMYSGNEEEKEEEGL